MQTRHTAAKITDANCRRGSKHYKASKIQKIQVLKKKPRYIGDLFGALYFLDVFDFLDFLDFWIR